MLRYLEEYINTLGAHRARRIHDVLRENRIDYDGLSRLVSRATGKTFTMAGRPTEVRSSELVDGYKIGEDFSRAIMTSQSLVGECNEIALILNSTKSLHETRLHSIENKITSLARLLRDFSFLYSGDPGYNWSWSDSFNNENNAEDFTQEESKLEFVDRDGTVIDELATIREEEGTLAIGEKDWDQFSPARAWLNKSNALEYLEDYAGHGKIADEAGNIKADFYTKERVNNPLIAGGGSGVQMIIRYVLQTPKTVNCIVVSNHSEHPIKISHIWVYEKEGGEESLSCEVIPDTPIEVFGKKSIYIPASNAKFIHILYTQDKYKIENYLPNNSPVDDTAPEDKKPVGGGLPLPMEPPDAWIFGDIMFSQLSQYGVNTAAVVAGLGKTTELYYHYSLYVDNILVGLDTSGSEKVLYVSKPINSEADLVVLSLQSEEEHPYDTTSDRETSRCTSVEYFISNDDGFSWIPIRTSNEAYVIGERLFVDNIGVATTRFPFVLKPPSRDVEFTLYCNGKVLPKKYYGIEDKDGEGIGVTVGAIPYSPADRYTADYTPAESAIVDLKELGKDRPTFSGTPGSTFRVAAVLRNSGLRPTSPLVYYIQLKAKSREEGAESG